ncbi:MAG: acyl-CoA dehydrogenase family protein [Anaerolineae bacterium]|nr:acyl-CoA dehydrogenase family protein [Anaerolineae bacterium]
MDFSFPPEMVAFRRMVREFAEEEVRPLAATIDREDRVPWETIPKLRQAGLLGVPFPQKYGGAGLGEMGYCILLEEMGRVCTSTATFIGAHIGIGAMAIYLGGTEEQKQRYLVPLARGEKLAAFALTEPGAGSDAAAIRTRAVRDGDRYILNGTKIYITNGSFADIISVMAVTDPALGARGGVTAFIVEKEYPGYKVGTIEDKMGIRGSATAELIFDEVEVPAANVLGQVGLGFVTFMQSLDVGRVTLGAACLGGAETALEMAIRYARVREQFGRPLAHLQSVQFMVAEMAAEIEALRSLVYRTAWLVDTKQPFTKEAGMCKLLGSEIASRCVDRAMQIHGALGYSRDFPLERMLRDSRIAELFEGTNEIQRIVIATELFREAGVRIRP